MPDTIRTVMTSRRASQRDVESYRAVCGNRTRIISVEG